LEVHDERFGAFPPVLVSGCSIAARDPDAAAFPARTLIVDAALETLCVKAERVGDAERHELSADEITHTPASGPRALLTVPPMSSAPICISPRADCDAAMQPVASAARAMAPNTRSRSLVEPVFP
jgi:hypothetical protein